MACVRLPGLSRANAEVALVKLWCRLEEHGLPSPKLDIVSEDKENDTVQLALLYADSAQASAALQGWAEEVQEQFGGPTPRRKARAAKRGARAV